MDTQSRYFRLHRRDIAYFKFIIESYEGMAVLRTRDPREAIVELMVAPGWEKDLEAVLEGLREEITIEPLEPECFLAKMGGLKFEARNSKLETSTNVQNPNDRNK
ncbi:MAG: DUF4911 domain-containing protein [Syntrophaceae bacterium]|nr:DUF4911 domain-containing protein [Syntrophaceae bacterium]